MGSSSGRPTRLLDDGRDADTLEIVAQQSAGLSQMNAPWDPDRDSGG
jgi:hypothetical protein